jgi:hypothetical protein
MRKSKPQVLMEFTKHLFERDPMGICYPDNPNKETEYDGEALSILSRFVEAHIISMPPEDAAELSFYLVQNAFEFWFTHPLRDEDKARSLAAELLDIFQSAYPEQDEEPVVVSADEERSGDGSRGLPGVAPGETPPGKG